VEQALAAVAERKTTLPDMLQAAKAGEAELLQDGTTVINESMQKRLDHASHSGGVRKRRGSEDPPELD
jgi:hypothetical protein